jgi:hypothetical protein
VIELREAKPPAFLKLAFYGYAGSGKTFTAAKVLSQFIRQFAPDLQLAMYDTEGGGGYIGEMVKVISGKPLLIIPATSFAELKDFVALCSGKYVGLIDSVTHPWRTLCEDFLDAKKSRVSGAGGNPNSTKLSGFDYGPIKEVWNRGFSDPFKFLPAHLCYCGRAGVDWETKIDEEGKEQSAVKGTKMKAEGETAYEASLLVEMLREPNPNYALGKSTTQWLHEAQVVKDRTDRLTGHACNDPDIEFFRPHIEFLMGGTHMAPTDTPPATFEKGTGKGYETLKRERQSVLDEIQDDLVSAYPGQSAAEKKLKVDLVRGAFGTSSWTALQGDEKTYPTETLYEGRQRLLALITQNPKKEKE